MTLGAAGVLAAVGAGPAGASSDSTQKLGGPCPGKPSVEMTTNYLGDVSDVVDSCGGAYGVESAVEISICTPDAENLGIYCGDPFWDFGGDVKSGTTAINDEGLFITQVAAGFRYWDSNHWVMVTKAD